MISEGTKYACNNNFMEAKYALGWGPDIPEILITIGTKYACNDLKFLNGFRTKHDHIKSIFKIKVISGIFGPHRIRLQADMVLSGLLAIKTGIGGTMTDIASIFGSPNTECIQKVLYANPSLLLQCLAELRQVCS